MGLGNAARGNGGGEVRVQVLIHALVLGIARFIETASERERQVDKRTNALL